MLTKFDLMLPNNQHRICFDVTMSDQIGDEIKNTIWYQNYDTIDKQKEIVK